MDEPELPTITFHFEKGTGYATHHADGVLGGETPIGDIYFAFYVERPVIPKVLEQEIRSDGTLGDVVRCEGREGIYREIQTGVIMSKEAATVLRDRLNELLEEKSD